MSDALSQRQKLKRRLVSARGNVYCGASLNPNPNNMVTQRHHTKNKDMEHKYLLIRSMEEDCYAAEQHRRWINIMPCRRTEILPKIERWIKHFEKAKKDPIQFEELDPENTEMSMWYWEFLIEIRHLRRSDKVFA